MHINLKIAIISALFCITTCLGLWVVCIAHPRSKGEMKDYLSNATLIFFSLAFFNFIIYIIRL